MAAASSKAATMEQNCPTVATNPPLQRRDRLTAVSTLSQVIGL